ncbi:hypothetical protein SSS_05299 [Sarcoptes scabiei]|uniref:Uncharacterized protein n=1 Tax=Sarcoptes scabiei TaxID=52283 RepID=A0A834R118_SARSC|nr:hypothetical protein SSS_05299 [Sarcoptes scabiei]
MEEESSIKSKSLALTRKIQRLHQALICNQLTVVSDSTTTQKINTYRGSQYKQLSKLGRFIKMFDVEALINVIDVLNTTLVVSERMRTSENLKQEILLEVTARFPPWFLSECRTASTLTIENVIDKLRNQCNYVETTTDRVRRQNFPPKKEGPTISHRSKVETDNGYRNMRMNYQNQNSRIDDRNRNTKSGNRYQSLSSNERLINYNQEENLRSPYNDFTEKPRIHKDEDGNLPARFKNLNLSSEDEEEFVQQLQKTSCSLPTAMNQHKVQDKTKTNTLVIQHLSPAPKTDDITNIRIKQMLT